MAIEIIVSETVNIYRVISAHFFKKSVDTVSLSPGKYPLYSTEYKSESKDRQFRNYQKFMLVSSKLPNFFIKHASI